MKQVKNLLVVALLCGGVASDVHAVCDRDVLRTAVAVGTTAGVLTMVLCNGIGGGPTASYGLVEGGVVALVTMYFVDLFLGRNCPERWERQARYWEHRLAHDRRLQLSPDGDDMVQRMEHEQLRMEHTVTPLGNAVADLKRLHEGSSEAGIYLMELLHQRELPVDGNGVRERIAALTQRRNRVRGLIERIEHSDEYDQEVRQDAEAQLRERIELWD